MVCKTKAGATKEKIDLALVRYHGYQSTDLARSSVGSLDWGEKFGLFVECRGFGNVGF